MATYKPEAVNPSLQKTYHNPSTRNILFTYWHVTNTGFDPFNTSFVSIQKFTKSAISSGQFDAVGQFFRDNISIGVCFCKKMYLFQLYQQAIFLSYLYSCQNYFNPTIILQFGGGVVFNTC
jgi:hypothetical protein